jgi:transposase-like protein
MDETGFRGWLSGLDVLTTEQRLEVLAILSGRPSREDVAASVEGEVVADRVCPHCAAPGATLRGRANGLRRLHCGGCGRTFNALTGTSLAGLHHMPRWLAFAQSLSKHETVREAAARCGIAVSTAFRWRHRFLRAGRNGQARLGGIVEADQTYVLESRKGSRLWSKPLGEAVVPDRKPRKRGGKAAKRGLSGEQVPVLIAADRSGATLTAVLEADNAKTLAQVLGPAVAPDAMLVTDADRSLGACARLLGLSHQSINHTQGERVRGELHIQTVNSRAERLKDMLRHHRGVATRYLGNYLNWFHLVTLNQNPSSRTCLSAAIRQKRGDWAAA